MKTASMIGSTVVLFALLFYSIGYTKERRKQLITPGVLLFYTIGIALDVTATIFMIIGSSHGMLTLHGFFGYSALLGMVADTIILRRHYIKMGPDIKVTRGIQLYSNIAYSWWIIAFITGGLLVAVSKMYK